MNKLKILLADDHEVFLDGLEAIFEIEQTFEVIERAQNGDEVLRKIDAGILPDLVIMDINMPKKNGIETTSSLKASHPSIKVLILSSHNRSEFIRRLKESGADGYILKNAGRKELLKACRALAADKSYFGSEVMKTDFDQGLRKSTGSTPLSVREKQVVKLIAEGRSTQQIAKELKISTNTVNTHRKSIISKIHISTPAGITQYAIKTGILEGFDIQ